MSLPEDLNQVHWNVRYLASTVNSRPQTWAATLQKRTGIELYRCEQILRGAPIERQEIAMVAAAFEIDLEELQSNPIYGHGDESILRLNLRYLINSLPHGAKKNLAKAIGVAEETISKWTSYGSRGLHPRNLSRLLMYFGLHPQLDLAEKPIFLSMDPVGAHLQKAWLIQRIQEAPPEEIGKVFPALQRIFRKDEKD